jgi:hypothetical protein
MKSKRWLTLKCELKMKLSEFLVGVANPGDYLISVVLPVPTSPVSKMKALAVLDSVGQLIERFLSLWS